MFVNFNDIAVTSIETITAFDYNTGAFKFALDELQSATISQSEDSRDITGKQGRKLNTLKRNKAVTISATNGLVSGGLFEMQTGGTFENKATKVRWTDYLKVSTNEATTSYKAVGTQGAEIVALYVRNADGSLGTKLVQDATAASGKFAYAPATKKLTFNGLTDGTEIVVFYDRNITADVLTNNSGKYSGKCKLYVDALGEDSCSNVYRLQFCIYKADFNGNFSLEMGDNQTVHGFEANALAAGCGANGDFFTYTVFGANVADTDVT